MNVAEMKRAIRAAIAFADATSHADPIYAKYDRMSSFIAALSGRLRDADKKLSDEIFAVLAPPANGVEK